MSTYNGSSISGTPGISSVSTGSGATQASDFKATNGAVAITAEQNDTTGSTTTIQATNQSNEGTAISANGPYIAIGGVATGTSGIAVSATASATTGTTYGVYATTAGDGAAVYATCTATSGQAIGVQASTSASSGYAVYGNATSTTGTTYGGAFQNESTSGTAVSAGSTATSGTTYGVSATAASGSGYGIYATNTASSGGTAIVGVSGGTGATGIQAEVTANSSNALYALAGSGATNSSAVYALATANSSCIAVNAQSAITNTSYGSVYALNTGTGNAVYASSSTGFAVYATTGGEQAVYGLNSGGVGIQGETTSAGAAVWGVYGQAPNAVGASSGGVYGYGVYIGTQGDVQDNPGGYAVYGTCATANTTGYSFFGTGNSGSPRKTFVIDHPLDPENKWLIHASVESPDMKNIYDGVGLADAQGELKVDMPHYFEVLNETFRYQLTAIGAPAPNLHVRVKLSKGSFVIAGANPNQEISWQVTGIRKDPYAKTHPVIVEAEKGKREKGTYMHPSLYGKPETMGMDLPRRAKN